MKKIVSLIFALLIAFSVSTNALAANEQGTDTNSDTPVLGYSIFDQAESEGAIITYTESGIPIVDFPEATLSVSEEDIVATTIVDTPVYTNIRCNTVRFIIPAGKLVTVLKTDTSYNVVQIEYTGLYGWVYPDNLQLGDMA